MLHFETPEQAQQEIFKYIELYKYKDEILHISASRKVIMRLTMLLSPSAGVP
jgi:hypothetical protein